MSKTTTNAPPTSESNTTEAQKLGMFRVGNVSVTAWERVDGDRTSRWISPAQKSYREGEETKYTSSLHEQDVLNAIQCQTDALALLRRRRSEEMGRR